MRRKLKFSVIGYYFDIIGARIEKIECDESEHNITVQCSYRNTPVKLIFSQIRDASIMDGYEGRELFGVYKREQDKYELLVKGEPKCLCALSTYAEKVEEESNF